MEDKSIGNCRGYEIFKKKNEAGGNTYYSAELGQQIWDTCISDADTQIFCIIYELGEEEFKKRFEKIQEDIRNGKD